MKLKKYLKSPKDTLKFLRDKNSFLTHGGIITHNFPILTEYREQSGSAHGHYFHQDLLVASLISKNQPTRHIDVGSRVDGFVAHVASFRKIDIVDIRPLQIKEHPQINYLQADLMKDSESLPIADSVSCLHAIEHFGLGRYGDPVDPIGHHKGFLNLSKMVTEEGILYISFPIANQNEVHFNAHRVFHPQDILGWPEFQTFTLERFDYVDDAGALHQEVDLFDHQFDLTYGCGIYTLRKNLSQQ